jgi:hypothetical protein
LSPEADYESVYRVTARRALAAGDPALLQLHFATAVLDRYREGAAYSVIRTNAVGRVRRQGGWSLDFGIAPEEDAIHVAWADLQNLPESEREHWATHATLPPSSRMFLSMRLAPGSCFDDGDVRDW